MIRADAIDAGPIAPSLRLVIHEAEDGGYWAEFPAFPGVYAEGETLDEVRRAAEATLTRYFEARARRAAEAAEARALADADGPIPDIPARGDDLGIRLPLPGRVMVARAAAARRIEQVLDQLPDDPPGVDEALMAALDARRPAEAAFAERVNGA